MKLLIKVVLGRLSPSCLVSIKCLCLRFISYLSRITPHISSDTSLARDVNFHEISESAYHFALDTNSVLHFAKIETNQPISITWGHSDTVYNKYIGVLLRENEYLELGSPIQFKNSWLRLSFAPAFKIDYKPNATLNLQFVSDNSTVTEICCLNILGNQSSAEWFTFEIDLQNFDEKAGFLRLSFIAKGSENPADSVFVEDYPLVISKFTIGPKGKLALLEARTFQDVRIANEVGHFSEVYEHEMYKSKQYAERPISITRLDDVRSTKPIELAPSFRASPPLLDESVYAYTNRLLGENLLMHEIDFSKRILALSERKPPLRILSLCSGSARNEAAFDAITGHTNHWTLQDLNEDLLNKARKQFSPISTVEFLVGDVNTIQNTGRSWDVIMCVSGLHHVVELERVIKFISESLTPDGEFWLIGEYVGKNGNRLHPTAQVSADKAFKSLPSTYRFNHHTKEIDSFVPKNDYSIDCFEGIRADEIESVISLEFFPLEISRNNSFLWRLVNLAYADNYDLKHEDDIFILESLVKAELSHFNKHRDGTTLNAVYKRL
jgi:ubiquinone/menaquinone biosynthesis C-methylase UbiE